MWGRSTRSNRFQIQPPCLGRLRLNTGGISSWLRQSHFRHRRPCYVSSPVVSFIHLQPVIRMDSSREAIGTLYLFMYPLTLQMTSHTLLVTCRTLLGFDVPERRKGVQYLACMSINDDKPSLKWRFSILIEDLLEDQQGFVYCRSDSIGANMCFVDDWQSSCVDCGASPDFTWIRLRLDTIQPRVSSGLKLINNLLSCKVY